MGLFDKLKDKIGIGSLKAEIELAQPGYSPGETVSGHVVLHSAASDTKIASVLVQLVNFGTDVAIHQVVTDSYHGTAEEYHGNKYKFNEVVFETYLAQDFVVASRQRLELPFEIGTTPDVAPSTPNNGYVIKAQVAIPGQIDAKATKRLHIMIEGAPPPQMGGPMGGPVDVPMGAVNDGDLPIPGERVLAYWADDDTWYEATVGYASHQAIHVTWDDGISGTLSLEQVLPSASAIPGPGDLATGMRVMARYEMGFYEATVTAFSGQQIVVTWDDGARGVVSLGDIRML